LMELIGLVLTSSRAQELSSLLAYQHISLPASRHPSFPAFLLLTINSINSTNSINPIN
jgi:hypothetical protein